MNPTAITRHPRFGVVVWVLAVLVALAGVFAPAASATTGVGPETRVRANALPEATSVAAVDLGSSTGVGVSASDLRQLVSATGVATEAAGTGAESAAQAARLNSRLTAEEIASGHAFEKHVVTQGEFPGIRTRSEFADMIENVVNDYGDIKHLSGGRTAYWRDGVVVIRNPSAVDGGTAFVPRDGYAYFEGL